MITAGWLVVGRRLCERWLAQFKAGRPRTADASRSVCSDADGKGVWGHAELSVPAL